MIFLSIMNPTNRTIFFYTKSTEINREIKEHNYYFQTSYKVAISAHPTTTQARQVCSNCTVCTVFSVCSGSQGYNCLIISTHAGSYYYLTIAIRAVLYCRNNQHCSISRLGQTNNRTITVEKLPDGCTVNQE